MTLNITNLKIDRFGKYQIDLCICDNEITGEITKLRCYINSNLIFDNEDWTNKKSRAFISPEQLNFITNLDNVSEIIHVQFFSMLKENRQLTAHFTNWTKNQLIDYLKKLPQLTNWIEKEKIDPGLASEIMNNINQLMKKANEDFKEKLNESNLKSEAKSVIIEKKIEIEKKKQIKQIDLTKFL